MKIARPNGSHWILCATTTGSWARPVKWCRPNPQSTSLPKAHWWLSGWHMEHGDNAPTRPLPRVRCTVERVQKKVKPSPVPCSPKRPLSSTLVPPSSSPSLKQFSSLRTPALLLGSDSVRSAHRVQTNWMGPNGFFQWPPQCICYKHNIYTILYILGWRYGMKWSVS